MEDNKISIHTCKYTDSGQIWNCHCIINLVFGQEMTKSIDEWQESSQIKRLIFKVECAKIAKSAGQKCPDSKCTSMNFSHYTTVNDGYQFSEACGICITTPEIESITIMVQQETSQISIKDVINWWCSNIFLNRCN